MSIKSDLTNIVGPDAVLDDEQSLAAFAGDQSFVSPRRPDLIVFAETVEQVQNVMRYANKTLTPVTPYSSGLNLHGATIPRQGGIILNLSRMNKIVQVDTENWSCVIEPGVTVRQLQEELGKHQLRAMLPFGAPPQRSALTSYLERDPAVAAASFEYGNELIMDTELVLPTGELFRTGLWSSGTIPGSPMGPIRAMVNRLWTGAQGTLGIMTKMNIKVEYLPVKRKIVLFQFDSFPEVLEPLRMIQRKEIGHECFVINNFNLSALLCKDWTVPEKFPAQMIASADFDALRQKLPDWLMILCLNGGPRMPEGKIAYEEEALRNVASLAHLRSYNDGQLESMLLSEMLRPWGILKKFCYRGSVHDISFKTPINKVPAFQKIFMKCINESGYPLHDVGMYVLPIERGRACHCEVDFHCDPNSRNDVARIKNLWQEVSRGFIDEGGAFFDRPYGIWADLVYSRAGTYTQKLKEIKREIDPNNICNPGQLCF